MFNWTADNLNHIRKHGVEPEEVEQVILNGPFDLGYAARNSEDRFVQLGETNAGRILRIVSTMRGTKIRPITAYDVKKSVRQKYAIWKRKRDEKEATNIDDS
jgi:uncharacterized DUF497 family protein